MEALLVCHVETNHNALSPTIVYSRYGAEPFLTRCVPLFAQQISMGPSAQI